MRNLYTQLLSAPAVNFLPHRVPTSYTTPRSWPPKLATVSLLSNYAARVLINLSLALATNNYYILLTVASSLRVFSINPFNSGVVAPGLLVPRRSGLVVPEAVRCTLPRGCHLDPRRLGLGAPDAVRCTLPRGHTLVVGCLLASHTAARSWPPKPTTDSSRNFLSPYGCLSTHYTVPRNWPPTTTTNSVLSNYGGLALATLRVPFRNLSGVTFWTTHTKLQTRCWRHAGPDS